MAKNTPSPRAASFEAALAYLTHPLSLAAVGVMLVNDVVLRQLWPGWWTGKLSDAAWLFFVPFMAAAGLGWLLPCRANQSAAPDDAARHEAGRRHRLWSFTLAYGITGLAFSLVKTLPWFNSLATRIVARALHIRPALRLDPSDLLALAGLALSAGWWLWSERRQRQYQLPQALAQRPQALAQRPLAWPRLAALPLVLLALLGDAAAPDTGITCFSLEWGKITARAGYQSYLSTDGGLTWAVNTPGSSPDCAPATPEPGQWREFQGPQSNQLYRYQDGAEIQVSADHGKTWQMAYRIPEASQAEQIYLVRAHSGSPVYEAGPLDAVADPASGNMLFAMGLRGVLLRTAPGQWVWSMSGTYQRPGSFPDPNAFGLLLGGMLILAAGLALLIYAALALRWTRRWPRVTLLILAALVWLGVDILFPPATSSSYIQVGSGLGLLALGILILPLVIEQTARLTRRAPRALPALTGIALAGGLVYCLPYLLWLYNLLPDFDAATAIALAAAGLVWIIGLFATRTFPRINAVPPATLLLLAAALVILSACSSGIVRKIERLAAADPTRTPFQPSASPAASPTPARPVVPSPSGPQLVALHRSGQTFLTWTERADLKGERYRVYRSGQPITAKTFAKTAKLAEVGKNSARFYASMFIEDGVWKYRYAPRLITQDNGAPTPEGLGLLVWTVGSEDFNGQSSGNGYYAVTITPAGGKETFYPTYTTGPVAEQVADPLPVEITHSPGTQVNEQSRVYVQYMDLRRWNPTYHAPNATNEYFGFDPSDPDVAAALAYAYDYQVYTPTPDDCGGQIPDNLPVMLFLHGARTNRYGSVGKNPYPHCAYTVFPIDESDTWYFGFARDHDYRKGGAVSAGDVIENYTERRVLRMIDDLTRNPPGPAVDSQRVYVFGHSMGGSGTLGFVERYPNVFAAGYSGQPISDYRTAGVTKGDWVANVSIKWGAPDLNLPIHIDAPNGWAQALQKYNGVGVWDWQNYLGNLTGQNLPASLSARAADEMAPFGIDHGIDDDVILWPTQGQAFYPAVANSLRVWSGAVTTASHAWSDFAALPPSLAKQGDDPFWALQVKRDESLPALSRLSSNLTGLPEAPTPYNQTVKWSSSWDAWDKAPVDQPELWRMSFCAVQPGATDCGTGQTVTADITPRRLQHFKVQPGQKYEWENRLVSNNGLVARGAVTADANGLITVKGFRITPAGNRLLIKAKK